MTDKNGVLKIEANSHWPKVELNKQTGVLEISGRSIVENAIRFFEPIMEWIDAYCEHPAEKTELHLKLEYFNTSTSKYILSIFEKLEEIFNEGKEVEIFWYSFDEDMEELGEDYQAMVDVPFQFLKYSNN